MQIASKSVKCFIGRIPVQSGETANIPINGTLKLSVAMSNDQKTLVQALIGKEALENQASIFIESILEELSTLNRGE